MPIPMAARCAWARACTSIAARSSRSGAAAACTIGDHTHIQSHCNVKGFLGNTHIGSHVQIAPHCGFSPYEHGFDDLATDIRQQGIASAGDIVSGG